MNRRQWMPWIAATVSVAALVHLGTLYALPRRIEARVLTRMGGAGFAASALAGGRQVGDGGGNLWEEQSQNRAMEDRR